MANGIGPGRDLRSTDAGEFLPADSARLRNVRLERGQPPSRWVVRLVIGYVVVTQVAAIVGDLNTALWFDRHPALLIALNPRNRILTLTTIHLDAATYYTVGFLRLVASDPVYYLLGYWYGDRAIAWIERRSRTYGPIIREGQNYFRKIAYPLIFIMPNNIICAMSAATGVRILPFIALNLSGTVARLVLIRQLGETFESPLQGVGGFIAEYRIQIFIISAIAVAWTVYNEFFSGQGEARSLLQMTSEEGTESVESDEQAVNDGDSDGETQERAATVLDVEDPVESDG